MPKRQRIGNRYVSRRKDGTFSKNVNVGRSLSADRRTKAKRTVKAGYGDKGDVKRAESKFDKLSNEIAKDYEKKGKSKEEADKIGNATAYKIGVAKYGKRGMERKARAGGIGRISDAEEFGAESFNAEEKIIKDGCGGCGGDAIILEHTIECVGENGKHKEECGWAIDNADTFGAESFGADGISTPTETMLDEECGLCGDDLILVDTGQGQIYKTCLGEYCGYILPMNAEEFGAESFAATQDAKKVYVVSRRCQDYSEVRELEIFGIFSSLTQARKVMNGLFKKSLNEYNDDQEDKDDKLSISEAKGHFDWWQGKVGHFGRGAYVSFWQPSYDNMLIEMQAATLNGSIDSALDSHFAESFGADGMDFKEAAKTGFGIAAGFTLFNVSLFGIAAVAGIVMSKK